MNLLRMRQTYYERMRNITHDANDEANTGNEGELGLTQQDMLFMERLQKMVAENMRDEEFSIDQLAATVRSIANYGSTKKYVFDYIGRNSRIDELQAAILSVKLKYLDEDNARRRTIAAYYASCINHPAITIPGASGLSFLNILFTSQNVFHIFPVLCEQRDALQAYLAEQGVQTMIHYPIPPHKQACYADWHNLCLPVTERIHDQELSIPCHQAMTDAEVERVAEIINNFNT